jgi:thymidine kinase
MYRVEVKKFFDIEKQSLDNYESILIDEGQFFEDVCEVAEKLSNMGKTVIVAALNADYKREVILKQRNFILITILAICCCF